MSACIYHDAEAVAICPSCDFGVCQSCLDGGSDGVCQTCLEEREFRQKNSAVQREYVAEAVVPRCGYCRAQADEETPLDPDGYCPTCSILSRCVTHHDLIAVGPCKGCRRDFCRKCLGFTDVCPTCTSQNRVRAKNPTKPMNAPGRSPTKPMKGKAQEPAATRAATGKSPAGKGGTGKVGAGGRGSKDAKGTPEEKGRRSRGGREAMEAKLQANAGNLRYQIGGALVVVLVLIFGAFSFLRVSASSPEEQALRLQEQMVAVHKAVMNHQSQRSRLPRNQAELMASLQSVQVPDRRHLKLQLRTTTVPLNVGEPNTVYFQLAGDDGFVLVATDREGKPLVDARGAMIMLDQYTPLAP